MYLHVSRIRVDIVSNLEEEALNLSEFYLETVYRKGGICFAPIMYLYCGKFGRRMC
jgi:hypothetical protein